MNGEENRDVREVAKTAGVARRIESARLFDGARELLIDHEGECYRLRCTSKGKLILTK
jgi:hemin uptake protein HemP